MKVNSLPVVSTLQVVANSVGLHSEFQTHGTLQIFTGLVAFTICWPSLSSNGFEAVNYLQGLEGIVLSRNGKSRKSKSLCSFGHENILQARSNKSGLSKCPSSTRVVHTLSPSSRTCSLHFLAEVQIKPSDEKGSIVEENGCARSCWVSTRNALQWLASTTVWKQADV